MTAPAQPDGAATVRLVTINFWGLAAPLDRRLAVAIEQLERLAPDVVAMQEVRPQGGVAGATTADRIADALGLERCYATSLRWDDDAFYPGFPAGEEGLAVLSRWPIAEHRALPLPEPRPTEARILLSARIDSPAGPLWCHTTHLHWQLDDGLARERQVVAIDEAIRGIATEIAADTAADRAPPQLLCGDFNAPPDADEIRFLRGLTTLSGRRTFYQDAFARTRPGEPGYTWFTRNPHTKKLRALDFDRRIDYVFVTPRHKDGRGAVLDARVVLDEIAPDGVSASDHFGVLADVQIAPDPS